MSTTSSLMTVFVSMRVVEFNLIIRFEKFVKCLMGAKLLGHKCF